MEDKIERLEKKLAQCLERLEMYESDGPIQLFYELNRIINATVKYTKTKTIESLLATEGDEKNKTFERVMALLKNAKEHADFIQDYKVKLGITGEEEKDKARTLPIELVAKDRK